MKYTLITSISPKEGTREVWIGKLCKRKHEQCNSFG